MHELMQMRMGSIMIFLRGDSTSHRTSTTQSYPNGLLKQRERERERKKRERKRERERETEREREREKEKKKKSCMTASLVP